MLNLQKLQVNDARCLWNSMGVIYWTYLWDKKSGLDTFSENIYQLRTIFVCAACMPTVHETIFVLTLRKTVQVSQLEFESKNHKTAGLVRSSTFSLDKKFEYKTRIKMRKKSFWDPIQFNWHVSYCVHLLLFEWFKESDLICLWDIKCKYTSGKVFSRLKVSIYTVGYYYSIARPKIAGLVWS